jgi:hypothetical protein
VEQEVPETSPEVKEEPRVLEQAAEVVPRQARRLMATMGQTVSPLLVEQAVLPLRVDMVVVEELTRLPMVLEPEVPMAAAVEDVITPSLQEPVVAATSASISPPAAAVPYIPRSS